MASISKTIRSVSMAAVKVQLVEHLNTKERKEQEVEREKTE